MFHRPCPREVPYGFTIDGIERVTHCKLLGVIVQNTFSVDMHVNYILSIVFQALIVSRLLYVGCFLTAELSGTRSQAVARIADLTSKTVGVT